MAMQVIRNYSAGKTSGFDLGLPNNDDFRGQIRYNSSIKSESGIPLLNHRTEVKQNLRIAVTKDGQPGFETVAVGVSVSCSTAGFPFVKQMLAQVGLVFSEDWVDGNVFKAYEPTTFPVYDTTIDPDGPAPV